MLFTAEGALFNVNRTFTNDDAMTTTRTLLSRLFPPNIPSVGDIGYHTSGPILKPHFLQSGGAENGSVGAVSSRELSGNASFHLCTLCTNRALKIGPRSLAPGVTYGICLTSSSWALRDFSEAALFSS